MSLPLRFLNAELGATERQHKLPIAGMSLVGDRLMLAGQDARILSFEPMPRGAQALGPLEFVSPELRGAAAFVDMQASKADDPTKIVVAAACRERPEVYLWEIDRDPRAQDHERLRLARAHAAGKGLPGGRHALPVLPAPPAPKPLLLEGHQASIQSVDVQEAFALSASDDMTARIWDVHAGQEVLCMGHPHGVARALFMPASTLLVTACADRATRVWDLRASAHRPICVIQEPEGGGATGGGGLAVGQGSILASADGRGEVRLFDIPRRGAACAGSFELPTVAASLQFVFEGRIVACAGRDGDLYVVRLEDLASQAFHVQPAGPTGQRCPLSLLRAGRPLGTESGLSRCVLAFAFRAGSYGLGVLEETEGLASSDLGRPTREASPSSAGQKAEAAEVEEAEESEDEAAEEAEEV